MTKCIYYSLVYSHLSYGIEVWGSASKSNLNKLNILQHKAVRIISGVQYFQVYGQEPGPLPSSEPLYKNLEILKLDDIFKLNIAKFVYSTLTFQSPINFHEWFSYDHEIHNHSTRSGAEIIRQDYFDTGVATQTYTLHTKSSHNKYGENMIHKSGPILWNSIPEHIQGASSISAFKYQLKNICLLNMILTIPQITYMLGLITIIISITEFILITIDRGVTLIVAITIIITLGTMVYLCYDIEDPTLINLERMPKIRILQQGGTTH